MRRFLRFAHRWVGLVLALPLIWQGLTGCVLAVTPIWVALEVQPALTSGPAKPASAILAAATAARPDMVPVQFIPGAPGHPAVVSMAEAGQRFPALQLLVDPAEASVIGTQTPSAFYRWVHTVHEHMLLPQYGGRTVVGWFGVGLLFMGLSGLVIWWPAVVPERWRRAMTVRAKAKGARFQRELHGAFGFWFSLMMVVMSLSGVSMAWPQTARELAGMPPVQGPGGAAGQGERRREGGPTGRGGRDGGEHQAAPFDIDAVLQAVTAAVPGAVVQDMRLPQGGRGGVTVRLEITDALPGTPPVIATVDPAGRRVLSVQDPRSEPAGLLVIGWLRALHEGEAFGLPWRLIVLATGMVLPGLAVTGATLWLLKRRQRLRLAGQRRAALGEAAE